MKILKFFPCTIFCVVAIWVLCFITPPHTPLDNVTLMDKWVHILMYGGLCSVYWSEYWLKHERGFCFSTKVQWFVSLILPVLMGGLVELGQYYCTQGRRSGDWLDFFANSLGVVVGLILGRTLIRRAVHYIAKK